MKHTLHRSLVFWAGLLVIIFTCWAWWDAYSHISRLKWKQVTIISGARGLTIGRDARGRNSWFTNRETVIPYPASWPREFFQSPFLVRAKNVPIQLDPNVVPSYSEIEQYSADCCGPGSWTLYLPYWLILPALFIPWSLLLLWRARRLKNAAPSELP